ncbi:MAG: MFS transporter [Candidatus Oxydemutatoraceae bacterium WSBS_2016_MAG_OTU14]
MPPRYVKLAFVYSLYFAVLGIYLPYWSLYLSDLNFNAEAIGQLTAAVLVSRIFVSYWWSWIGDRFLDRIYLIRCIAIVLPLSFAFSIYFDSYFALFIILLIFGIFFHGLLPQIEAVTLHSLGHKQQHYSTIRVWGAIGFIILVVAMSPLIEIYGTHILPVSITIGFLCVAIATFFIKVRRTFATPQMSIKPFLKRPEILALLFICFLMQFSHGPYYAFFSIYLRENGYSDTWIGQIWALGVLAEIIVLLFMYRLIPRWGAPVLMGVAVFATVVRWVLLAYFPQNIGMLISVQLLHALTVGVYHAASIHLIDFFFTRGVEGRGQALFSTVSFGAGGTLGVFLSGALWEKIGGAQVFLIAGLASLIALFFVIPIYRSICRSG